MTTRLSLLCVIVLLAAPSLGTQSRLDAELTRVRAQISTSVPADEQATLVQRLDRAEAALKAGRRYQAIYLLEAAYEGAAAFAFTASSGVKSSEAFLKKWAELGPPKPRSGRPGQVPAAIDALAEAAEDRGAATYRASRPYAEDAGVNAGLYVRKMAASFKANYPIVMGTPEVIQAFGAVAAVPKLIVYDARGRRSKVLYGAPDDLHDQIEAALKHAAESR